MTQSPVDGISFMVLVFLSILSACASSGTPCLFYGVAEAVKNIIQLMGMQPCERSDKVPENKSSHTLIMAGVFRGRFIL